MFTFACVFMVSSMSGCRKVQEDATRRMRPDASFFDAGAIEASSCAQLTCVAPAECKVNNGVAACICGAGYNDDPAQPGACVDVDECADGTSDCDTNATCSNRPGSFDCTCKEGFGGNGKLCHSLNDCEGLANTCHSDAMCTRGDNGVMCSCTAGFEGDGHLCMDIDECEQGTAMCPADSTCQNRRATYDCSCNPGFEGDRNNCRDSCVVAQADATRCDPGGHGRCQVTSDGTAKCTSCQSDSLGEGTSCTANDECASLNCGDNTVCAGEAGSRRCECAPGYSGSDPKSGCSDIDECMNGSANCDANTTDCVNTQGGFVCECKQGLERKGGDCVDVDECALGLDLCDSGATCKNLPIGYTCECKPGYEGNGYACADVDECERGTAECSKDGLTICQNTRGGYQCLCPNGYAGDGKTEACYCDLSGWWGVRERATVTVPQRAAGNVVIIDRSTTHATIWELHHYVYDGNVIKEERQQCGADTGPEIYSPLYTETYTSSIPFMVYDSLKPKPQIDIPLPRAMALPGKPFVTPRDAVTQGIKLNDPLNDPWPAKHGDVSAWEDTDNDGEPGITLWPGQTTQKTLAGNGMTYSYLPVELMGDSTRIATRTGCVSTALRAIGHFEGNIASCTRLTGKVINDKTEGRVEGCAVLRENDWETLDVTCKRSDWNDARHCSDMQIEFLDDQDQTSETQADFESVKLGEASATDIDCAAVRKALPAE